ncbi:hypothetical protein FXO38_14514 [Capsicum annuum]|nr:hypothetical protein FXO38_14514 [Capsicum annuum]KAF3674716.1 hypothetical protein FXO37_06256 [Capsicum annuum]
MIDNVFVASALIDMYSKCGSVEDAWNVFSSAPFKNVASWNAMIGCYGKHGRVEHAIKLFEMMHHGGLVEKGLKIFWSMEESYGIRERKEYYACVIDLLCRVGRLEEAYNIIKDMPMDLKKPEGLVALSNVYAAEGEWANVENVMKDKGFNKMPGSSWL